MKLKRGLLIVLILYIFSCGEDIPDLRLPDKTQDGLNSLGFVIDGQIWTNYGTRCTFAGCEENEVIATLDKSRINSADNFELFISANYTVRGKEIDQSFKIYCKNITEVGMYDLNSANHNKMIFTASRYTQSFKEFVNGAGQNATLKITKFDTIDNIISGEFNGLLSNPENLSEKILIDQGRFDSKLDYRK